MVLNKIQLAYKVYHSFYSIQSVRLKLDCRGMTR